MAPAVCAGSNHHHEVNRFREAEVDVQFPQGRLPAERPLSSRMSFVGALIAGGCAPYM
jgi:hypothetical protein